MSAAAAFLPERCFHCGLGIPVGVDCSAVVLGVERPMCCIGCAAVAEMLSAQGLEQWYLKRESATGAPPRTLDEGLEAAGLFGSADIEAEYTTRSREGFSETAILIEGMSCAACVWIVEKHLERLAGIRSVRVHLLSHRAQVVWDPERCDLRDIIARLAEIGFGARPDRPDEAARMQREERKRALIRLGVAGLGTMNVMTYAVALYLGVVDGMEPGVRNFLRWMCLLVTTPVVFIGARPFFEGAVRDLRARRVGMDVPVALAIGGAYLASGWAVARGSGEVYFESACMFTFFLGLGRFFEMNVRHRATAVFRSQLDNTPEFARRIGKDGVVELVSTRSLAVGDLIQVKPGERIAADGRVVEGRGAVEEALLTGEPWPKAVAPGSFVVAGSLNAEAPLAIEATRVGLETTLAAVLGLVECAQSEKPRVASWADRVATRFVTGVLFVALTTAIVWSQIDPDRAIWITLAVLVATCPCALGLATPTALAAATQGLAQAGLLVTRGHVLEALAGAKRIVFDKTGTLTEGKPSLVDIILCRESDTREQVLARVRSLEAGSEHPLASAFSKAGEAVTEQARQGAPRVLERTTVPGSGIEGVVDGVRYRIGRPGWASLLREGKPREPIVFPKSGSHPESEPNSWVLLADERGAVAWFGIDDALRKETAKAIEALSSMGLLLEMLSGDPSPGSAKIAERLGLSVHVPSATPEAKLERIRSLQANGEGVVALGDGLNDGPLMRAAEVSIAMGSGCDLTRVSADAVLVSNDLLLIPRAIETARRTQKIIRQNFAWALGYNLCVLPLAVSGHLAPWLAALGMSASSLVVVLNARRLSQLPAGRA